MKHWPAHLVLGLLWGVHLLPLGVQAALGRALGRLLHRLGRSRRRVALRNVALCLPELDETARQALVREHFQWLGRSLLERGLLWYASPARLKRLIHVEGDIGLAERSERPVMWLVPHFVALDVAGASTQLFQRKQVASIYQAQSNPVFDAAMRRGRLRHNQGQVFSRHETALPLVRAVKRGHAFFNLPDMDFGLKDAAFVPFFHVEAATLLAPARMARSLNMLVQPVLAEILPGGQGWRVRFLPPWDDFPGADDDIAATTRMNRWIADEIRRNPAQYLWVHRRFKTRPAGQGSLYDTVPPP
ncbi:MAG: lipid A biosynthesis acyltransferase [Burkholderiales bacterium]|nr:lipid A biosynthesis acyltransferase [Burkholderiales bacterium]